MYQRRMTWSAQVVDVLSATGDHTQIFAPGMRVKVHAVGVTLSVATTGASAIVKFDRTIGATRGDGDGGVVTVPNLAVNQSVVDTTSSIFPYVLNAGSFITPEVTTASGAGSGFYYIIYEPLEENDANDSNVQESA